MIKDFLIKPSTVEDTLENWVWINESTVNGTVEIKNPKNKKSIVVFKRTIDENFINFYNSKRTNQITDLKKSIIVINEYYRIQLGIHKNDFCKLEIKNATTFKKIINSSWHHPNPTISLPYKISLISMILALLSIILGIISIT